MIHQFESVPPLGTVITIDGAQRFELVMIEPHIRKLDGEPTSLLSWSTECMVCTVPFLTLSGLQVGSLNRRCQAHKRPGQRVNRGRPRGHPLDVVVTVPGILIPGSGT